MAEMTPQQEAIALRVAKEVGMRAPHHKALSEAEYAFASLFLEELQKESDREFHERISNGIRSIEEKK